jgi:DNA-directed RNA polymerase specialized sigma24 family protein
MRNVLAANLQLHPSAWLLSSGCTGPDAIIFRILLANQSVRGHGSAPWRKFRSFLLASVKNFLADDWDRNQAIRRGGGYQFIPLDPEKAEAFYDAASAPDSTAERLFELRWAKSVTAGALNSLRQELQVEGKLQLFEQLKTFLAGGSVLPSYDDASARTGLARATVKTHVHRLRQRYREIVRCEIARTVSAPHEIDEELHYLCNVLAQAA